MLILKSYAKYTINWLYMVYIFGVYSGLYMVFMFDMVRLRKKNKVTIHHTKALKREERKNEFQNLRKNN